MIRYQLTKINWLQQEAINHGKATSNLCCLEPLQARCKVTQKFLLSCWNVVGSGLDLEKNQLFLALWIFFIIIILLLL